MGLIVRLLTVSLVWSLVYGVLVFAVNPMVEGRAGDMLLVALKILLGFVTALSGLWVGTRGTRLGRMQEHPVCTSCGDPVPVDATRPMQAA